MFNFISPSLSPSSSSPNVSPVNDTANAADHSEQPSSHSPVRMSKDSDGYPSWLPKRPPPPAPASTFHSSVGVIPDLSPIEVGGRKPTSRSVRIVSLQDDYPARSPARFPPSNAFSSTDPYNPSPAPRPRFRSRGLHLDLLRNPSHWNRLYYYFYPLFVFGHIPLQTFFDFNAVFMLIQVSKFPNPQAVGVPGSGRNWALGAAAYIACWAAWILVVFVMYEVVYSFTRRWRVKRPLILPIYLSSSAFNYASLSSYSTFCFFQQIRYSAFTSEHGSLMDGLAETFYFYSQNLPTVLLLLPRAALAVALLLSFSKPQAAFVAVADMGLIHRDGTFFTRQGTLTSYARGVLFANAAWTAWRTLVFFGSVIGLWIVSGQGCAGLCGPRYRWEEDELDKRRSLSMGAHDNTSELDSLAWSWRECTRLRVLDAYEFCLTERPGTLRWSTPGIKEKGGQEKTAEQDKRLEGQTEMFEGVERVIAAVSLPSPSRRGALSEDLFQRPGGPTPTPPPDLDLVTKSKAKGKGKSKGKAREGEGPLMNLPYPFVTRSAWMSSDDQVQEQEKVPFPPSVGSSSKRKSKSGSGSRSGTGSGSGLGSGSGTGEEVSENPEEGEEEEEEDVGDDDEEEDDDDDDDELGEEEHPSSGRASGSMSSLGHPISPRYPFQLHSGPSPLPRHQHSHHRVHSPSGFSGFSGSSQITAQSTRMSMSTGNRESTDSQSPMSVRTGLGSAVGGAITGGGVSGMRERASTSLSQSSAGGSGVSGIPMPPRHPRARTVTTPGETDLGSTSRSGIRNVMTRSGTTGTTSTGQTIKMPHVMMPAPVAFPSVRGRGGRGGSGRVDPGMMYAADVEHDGYEGGDNEGHDEDDDDDVDVDAERQDLVGLLGGSRTSLVGSNNGSSSGSGSGSASQSSRSRASSVLSIARSRVNSATGGSRSRTTSFVNRSRNSSVVQQLHLRDRTMSSSSGSASASSGVLPRFAPTSGITGGGLLLPFDRSRTHSLVASVRSLVGPSASLTQLQDDDHSGSGGTSHSGSRSASELGHSDLEPGVLYPRFIADVSSLSQHQHQPQTQGQVPQYSRYTYQHQRNASNNTYATHTSSASDRPGPGGGPGSVIGSGYTSSFSGGSHSRSASGSASASGGENYTFGQPVAFMRPHPSHLREVTVVNAGASGEGRAMGEGVHREVSVVVEGVEHGEGEEEAEEREEGARKTSPSATASRTNLSARVSETGTDLSTARGYLSARTSVAASSPVASNGSSARTSRGEYDVSNVIVPGAASPSVSSPSGEEESSAVFYSQAPSEVGVEHEDDDNEGRVGMPIPIHWAPHGESTSTNPSTSPQDISTAPGSFMTAPVTMDGRTTTAGSGSGGSDVVTLGGGGEAGVLGTRQDPSGGAWRIV